ncbi:MAG: ABC transporter substrate-binding protein [Aggregatilineales bacterium]
MRNLVRSLTVLVAGASVLGLVFPAAGQGTLLKFAAKDCKYGGEIKSIEAVNASTVQFTFCYPDPAFPAKAAFSAFDIHEAAQLQKTGGGGDALLSNPIGTGPYKLAKWDHGNEIDLVANDNYRGPAPKMKNVVIKWNKEATARWNELQAGTVDGISNVAPGDFASVQANSDFKLYPIPPANIFYLGINNRVKPFDNVLVRQAIAHAIDKKRIIDNFYPIGSSVADQFMPPSIFGNTPGAKTNEFDLNLAKQLMQQSGVTLPITTTLSYRDVVRGYLPQPGVVAQDLQAQLKQIGINVNITVMESGAFLDAASAGKLSLHLLGWGADYPDATDFLDYHFGKGASDQFGDKDAKLDDLLSKAGQLSDPKQRLALYKQANDEIANFVPMVPIAYGGSAEAFKASVAGAYGSPFAAIQLALLSRSGPGALVWMQNAEPVSLYCNDESDGETLFACEQINEALLSFKPGTGNVAPGLAASWSANSDSTQWTFKLVPGVKFSDGTALTANDVVLSWDAEWDAASPLHKGRTGAFDYFSGFFGGFLNPPPTATPVPPTAAPAKATPVATVPATSPATAPATSPATVPATSSATAPATSSATVPATSSATVPATSSATAAKK